jgi:hypothetical protein
MSFSAANATQELHRLTGHSAPTIRNEISALRRDHTVMRPGKQGPRAPSLSTSETINLVVALVGNTSHKRTNLDPIDIVRNVRAAPLARQDVPQNMLDGLKLADAKTAGAALDSILDDMRNGAWYERFGVQKENLPPTFKLRVHFRAGSVTIKISTLKADAMLRYRREAPSDELLSFVETERTLHDSALEELARAMGPPDKE